MSKKGKFDLGALINEGLIQEGEKLFFVSDQTLSGSVVRHVNGEFRIDVEGNALSPHAVTHRFLGQEPPTHASHWLKNEKGETLFSLWQKALNQDH